MPGPIEPKLFISYSWSSPDHEAWVLTLAEELVAQGVQVILDKWDLKPGHDANAFMETMVTDATVTKVLLVCDRKYAEKSNERSGGAGNEAQIITPELYAKKAQDKYVAIVSERDEIGQPYLPAYYGGRIYIDLSSPASYATDFERLLRWIWDKPLYVRPELGSTPSFLAPEQPRKIATSTDFRRAIDAVKAGAPNAAALVGEYFRTLSNGLENFRLSRNPSDDTAFDDAVVASIEEFTPLRNEAIEIFSAIAQYNFTDEILLVTHRFFESLIPYLYRPLHVNSWTDTDFDNFRFIVCELFLYAIATFIRHEKFEAANYMLSNEYFWQSTENNQEKMHTFPIFNTNVQSLSQRNTRLKLNRLSVKADMLSERATGTGIDFNFVMAADFVLYLRSIPDGGWSGWWPDTLVYVGRFGGPFEMFARAKSVRYFDRIKGLIGFANKQALGAYIQKTTLEPNMLPRWQYQRLGIGRLTAYDALATVP